jgi:hypothetical protein
LAGIGMMIALPLSYISIVAYESLNTPPVDVSKLDKFTPHGNYYYHDMVNFKVKDGKWTGLYICDKELRQAWSKRSRLSLDSLDQKKQICRYTLISYLASKDLRKDADGLGQLTDAEIRNIELGVNRYNYNKLLDIRSQIEDFVNSCKRYFEQNDPNSGSMVQRFEYWRASYGLIKMHPLAGVGTGDVPAAFQNQYQAMNSHLTIQNRLRSHNQYLSITVAFGLIGLLWFVFVMFYPGIKTRNFRNYFYLVFWLIFMISMFTEDTIENQEGVTFYTVFTTLMLLGREGHEKEEELDI